MPKALIFVLGVLFSLLFGCNGNIVGQQSKNQTIDSNHGISVDTLDLIYDGPQGFTLKYFPKKVIQANRIKSCVIIDSTDSSKTVRRSVTFDKMGNIIKDENNFFQFWFKGTVRGSYVYTYDGSNRLLKMVGISDENQKDSIMTINNYNQKGQLYSREHYAFSKKLKPDADKHSPNSSDHEPYPTWYLLETNTFLCISDMAFIKTIIEGNVVENEKYILQFDSLKRVTSIAKYNDTTFNEETRYVYESNTIAGYLNRIMNDGEHWKYNTKAIIGDKMNQVEKILYKSEDRDEVHMETRYNLNGTINSIKYENYIQYFRYSYY
jgi:hypothetical protein